MMERERGKEGEREKEVDVLLRSYLLHSDTSGPSESQGINVDYPSRTI